MGVKWTVVEMKVTQKQKRESPPEQTEYRAAGAAGQQRVTAEQFSRQTAAAGRHQVDRAADRWQQQDSRQMGTGRKQSWRSGADKTGRNGRRGQQLLGTKGRRRERICGRERERQIRKEKWWPCRSQWLRRSPW